MAGEQNVKDDFINHWATFSKVILERVFKKTNLKEFDIDEIEDNTDRKSKIFLFNSL